MAYAVTIPFTTAHRCFTFGPLPADAGLDAEKLAELERFGFITTVPEPEPEVTPKRSYFAKHNSRKQT